MSNAASSIVQRRLHEAQKYVLKMAGKLDDRQLRLLASPTSPSIQFHIWHLGRWADRVQSTVPGLTPALGAKARHTVHGLQLAPGVTRHRIALKNLAPGQPVHYRVVAEPFAPYKTYGAKYGPAHTSETVSFRLPAPADERVGSRLEHPGQQRSIAGLGDLDLLARHIDRLDRLLLVGGGEVARDRVEHAVDSDLARRSSDHDRGKDRITHSTVEARCCYVLPATRRRSSPRSKQQSGR